MSVKSKNKVRLLHPPVYPESGVDVICQRLSTHLARLRSDEPDSIAQTDPDERDSYMESHEADTEEADMDEADIDGLGAVEGDLGLGPRDIQRIRHRAKRIVARRKSANHVSLSHLASNRDKRNRTALLRLAGLVPFKAVADEAKADELAASLHAEFPWMGAATTAVWHSLRRGARAGLPISVGPLLLHGPPGIGKTAWAHGLSKVLDLPHCVIDAGQGLSSMILAGTERGWSDQQPGRPLQAVLSSRIANPLIVVEVVDKACAIRATSGVSYNFQSALLGLLEPGSARRWQCPYYRIGVDMSHLSWVLTANDVGLVPEPVRSRCEILQLGDLSVEELSGFAARQATRLGLPAAAADAVRQAIERTTMTGCRQRRLSLRDVSRMLGRAEELFARPLMH